MPLSRSLESDGFVALPEARAERYRALGAWAGVPIGSRIARSVSEHAERIAVIDGDVQLTYAELWERAQRFARHLVARGICQGETVLFQLPNTYEFAIAYVACLEVGAVPICALPHHRHTEVLGIGQLARPRAWFVAERVRGFDYLAMVQELLPSLPSVAEVWTLGETPHGPSTATFAELLATEPPPEAPRPGPWTTPASTDIAVLQLSGGTTGTPKLIPRTHDDYLLNSLEAARMTSMGRDDVVLLPIPLAHNFALACPGLQGALLVGATVVIAPNPSAQAAFPLIEKHRVTWTPAVPAVLIQWTEDPLRLAYDLRSLRQVYAGGQRLVPTAAENAVRAFGPVVRQVYGMAEGLLCFTSDEDGEERHIETQGRAMSPLDELRVVDANGAPVPPGELGELEVRGPYTIGGYFRAAEHNATAFTEDGFYRTGDMVRRRADGFLVVEGRRKDLINRGGEKISCEEIESLILSHEHVANVAVVAYPDPTYGERACACVELLQGTSLTLDDLVAYLKTKQIASFKLPERLEVFEKLPLTAVGKISKVSLRSFVAHTVEAEREELVESTTLERVERPEGAASSAGGSLVEVEIPAEGLRQRA